MERGKDIQMSDGGKGSLQRPTNKKKFDESYDRIFGNKKDEENKKKND